jgi:hypothetical protein
MRQMRNEHVMQLFEVIRWGNDSDDPVTGGPNGPDTCFLVRAASVEQAAQLVDRLPALRGSAGATADAVYLLGTEQSAQAEPRVLRGPYIQHAYRHGWRHWYRDDAGAPWVERD